MRVNVAVGNDGQTCYKRVNGLLVFFFYLVIVTPAVIRIVTTAIALPITRLIVSDDSE